MNSRISRNSSTFLDISLVWEKNHVDKKRLIVPLFQSGSNNKKRITFFLSVAGEEIYCRVTGIETSLMTMRDQSCDSPSDQSKLLAAEKLSVNKFSSSISGCILIRQVNTESCGRVSILFREFLAKSAQKRGNLTETLLEINNKNRTELKLDN